MEIPSPVVENHHLAHHGNGHEVGIRQLEDDGFAVRSLAQLKGVFLPLTEPLPYISDEVEDLVARATSMPHLTGYAQSVMAQLEADGAESTCITDHRLSDSYDRAEATLKDMKNANPVFVRIGNMSVPIVGGLFKQGDVVNVDPMTDRPLFAMLPMGVLAEDQMEAVYAGQLPTIKAVAQNESIEEAVDGIAQELVGFVQYLASVAPGVKNRAQVANKEHGTYDLSNGRNVISFTEEGFVFAGLPCTIRRTNKLHTPYASPVLNDRRAVPSMPTLVFENRYGEQRSLTGTTIALLIGTTYPGLSATAPKEHGVQPAQIDDLAYLAQHVKAVRQGATVSV